MAEFNLRMQRYHDGSVLGLRLYMLRFWMSYQNKRFWESYWPAFIRTKEKKSGWHIIIDLLKLTYKWKCLPYHYFRYSLYKKGLAYKDLLRYLPETVFFYQILPQINKQLFLLDDKNAFESMVKGFKIRFPNTIFKIIRKTIYDGEMNTITDPQMFAQVIKKAKSKTLFCKPADCGSGGKGIFTFNRVGNSYSDDQNNELNYSYIKEMSGGEWIIQESVENIQAIKEIYEYSTNSFRVLTYFKPGEGAKVIYSILKFGNNKAVTDNAHTGGVYVKVDPKTGNLDDTAYDEDLNTYKEHPLTKVKFKNKKIPNIDQIVSLAERLGNLFPNLTFVGWDIALTSDGPVVLEGNSSPGLTIIQRTYNGMQEFIELVQKQGILK